MTDCGRRPVAREYEDGAEDIVCGRAGNTKWGFGSGDRPFDDGRVLEADNCEGIELSMVIGSGMRRDVVSMKFTPPEGLTGGSGPTVVAILSAPIYGIRVY